MIRFARPTDTPSATTRPRDGASPRLGLGPTWTSALMAAVTFAGGALTAQAQYDQVYPPTGSPVRGTITEVRPEAVTISVSGSDRTIPVDQIRRVTFNSDPPELVRAREAALDSRYEDAIRELTALGNAPAPSKPIEQDIAFYRAESEGRLALGGKGDPLKAAATVNSFLQAHPTSYHFFPAKELFAELAFVAGRFGPAETQFGELVNAPFAEMKLRAKLRQADAQRYGGKAAEAVKNYDQVLGARGAGEEFEKTKQLATVGKAAAQAEAGEADQALEALRNLVKTNDASDQLLFGRIYNAMGDAYLAKQDKGQALLSYLKTHLLFFGDPSVHAESLYHLASLWESQGQTERAVESRNLLKSKYSGGYWASKS